MLPTFTATQSQTFTYINETYISPIPQALDGSLKMLGNTWDA